MSARTGVMGLLEANAKRVFRRCSLSRPIRLWRTNNHSAAEGGGERCRHGKIASLISSADNDMFSSSTHVASNARLYFDISRITRDFGYDMRCVADGLVATNRCSTRMSVTHLIEREKTAEPTDSCHRCFIISTAFGERPRWTGCCLCIYMPAYILGQGERILSRIPVGVNCNALCKREDVKNSTSAAHMGIVIRQPRCFASPQYSRPPFCFASAGFDMSFMSIEMRFLYNFVAIGMRLWLSKPIHSNAIEAPLMHRENDCGHTRRRRKAPIYRERLSSQTRQGLRFQLERARPLRRVHGLIPCPTPSFSSTCPFLFTGSGSRVLGASR
jgi:hypothetical protein